MASPKPPKSARSTKPPPPPPPAMAPKAKAPKHTPKTFQMMPWTGQGEGEKIVVYGSSGAGKTTLAAQYPTAKFLGLDDGGRKIRNPLTGKPVLYAKGVQTFADVLDAIHQTGLWEPGDMCVIDTFTILEALAEPYIFETIKHEKGGTVENLEGYGYGKGYTHLCDTMRMVLQELDALIRNGVHVCLICQNASVKRANPAGLDFLEDGPKLSHPSTEKNSVRLLTVEWADHVARVDLQGSTTVTGAADAKLGKAVGTITRRVVVEPAAYFIAKSRTITEPIISFEDPKDDSFWQFVFPD